MDALRKRAEREREKLGLKPLWLTVEYDLLTAALATHGHITEAERSDPDAVRAALEQVIQRYSEAVMFVRS